MSSLKVGRKYTKLNTSEHNKHSSIFDICYGTVYLKYILFKVFTTQFIELAHKSVNQDGCLAVNVT